MKRNNKFAQLFISILCLFSVTVIIFCQENKNSTNENETNVKNILVIVFPGGKSHNFILKELFDYSLQNEQDYKIQYHILVHNWDKDAWPEEGPYIVHGYGDMLLYDIIFNDALDLVRKDPIFGYSKFNKAMIHIYEQFFESKVLDTFRKIKFETMITDIPNFITKFLRTELNIPNCVFVSPPSLPNLFYGILELNPSYFPTIGSTFTDIMSFQERFLNSLYFLGMKGMFWLFMGEQVNTFKHYGYDLGTTDVFVKDSFVMIQYAPGFFFNLSIPPNFILLNAISPKPALPIKESEPTIDSFMNKFSKNIYFSQGTIVKIVDFDKVIEIFNHFSNYGFILAFKKKWINSNLIEKFPKNVMLVSWVKQNDLLGDPRLHAFITHGGTNSVSESLYHFKPMIVLGVTLDQINTASVVKQRGVGIVLHDSNEINSEKLTWALQEILKPEDQNSYVRNCRKYGNLIRQNKDPRREYTYWINYGFRHGYKHLHVRAYTEYNFVQLYNYDVVFVWVMVLLLLSYSLKKLFVFLFCSCKPKRKLKDE